MVLTHVLSADLDFQVEFLKNLKERNLEQKFIYFGESAKLFYEGFRSEVKFASADIPTVVEVVDELRRYMTLGKNSAVVSIGCGNSAMESQVLPILQSEGFKFTYFGIDSSAGMLDLTREVMESQEFSTELLLGDFSSSSFPEEVTELTSSFDNRVYLFFGNTIGNMTQTLAVDALYNILSPGEVVILESAVRQSLKKDDDLKIFRRVSAALTNERQMNFFFHTLSNMNIPYQAGKMVLETIMEESIGAFNARFSFEFSAPVIIHTKKEVIHFLPPERVKLVEVRYYHPETFIRFFEAHDFSLENVVQKNRRGLFTFRKEVNTSKIVTQSPEQPVVM